METTCCFLCASNTSAHLLARTCKCQKQLSHLNPQISTTVFLKQKKSDHSLSKPKAQPEPGFVLGRFFNGSSKCVKLPLNDLRPLDPAAELEALQYAATNVPENDLPKWMTAFREALALARAPKDALAEFAKARKASVAHWKLLQQSGAAQSVSVGRTYVSDADLQQAFLARLAPKEDEASPDDNQPTATNEADDDNISVVTKRNDNKKKRKDRSDVAPFGDNDIVVNHQPPPSRRHDDDSDFVDDLEEEEDVADDDIDDVDDDDDDVVARKKKKAAAATHKDQDEKALTAPVADKPPKKKKPNRKPKSAAVPPPSSPSEAEPAEVPAPKRRARPKSAPANGAAGRKSCVVCRRRTTRDEILFQCERCSDVYHTQCIVKVVDDYRKELASTASTRRAVDDDALDLPLDDPDMLQDRADALAGKPQLSWYCVTCRQPTIDQSVRSQRPKLLQRGVAGLLNVANTCYINAAVQVVHALTEFCGPLLLCMSDAARVAAFEQVKQAVLRRRMPTTSQTGKPQYKVFCEIEEQARMEAAALRVQAAADESTAAAAVAAADAEAPEPASLPTVVESEPMALDPPPPPLPRPTVVELDNAAELSTPEQRRAQKQQRYVDALLSVVQHVGDARCGGVSFHNLVNLKSASGNGLALKYYTNIHQDINEYMTHALDCVHELTKLRDEDEWTSERAAEARALASELLAREEPLAPIAASAFSARMLAYCAPERVFATPQGTLVSVPLVNPEAFGDASVQRRHREAWERYLAANRSLVASVFDGMFTRIRTCPHGHKSYSDEMFRVLSLTFPVPNNKWNLRLSDLIGEFNRPETLECRCDQCDDKQTNQNFTSVTTISHFPGVLALHFSRFRTTVADEEWGANKIKRDVAYPLNLQFVDVPTAEAAAEAVERADAEASLENARVGAIYDLVAVICHQGTYSQGHYYAYVRDPPGEEALTDTWFKLDDGNVSKMTAKQVQSALAYMLFYRKRKQQQ